MHVCHIVINNLGGAAKVADLLVSRQAAAGHRVSVIVTRDYYPEWGTFAQADQLKILHVNAAKLRHLTQSLPLRILYSEIAGAVKLKRMVSQLQPDVVIAHTTDAARAYWFSTRLPGSWSVPSIAYIQADLESETQALLKRPWLAKLAVKISLQALRHAQGLVVVCRTLLNNLEQLGLRHPRAVVSYNPIAPSSSRSPVEFHPIAAEWFQDSQIVPFVCAARLDIQKDHTTLLQAFAQVVTRFPQARLILLGDGPLRSPLEDLTTQLNLQDKVLFTGFVANCSAYFAQARAAILSSHWEGFPLVLVEAIAAGTSFIATDCPTGPREIQDLFQTGHLVRPRDPKDLANAIAATLTDPPHPLRAQQHLPLFSPNRCVQVIEDLIGNLVRRPRLPVAPRYQQPSLHSK